MLAVNNSFGQANGHVSAIQIADLASLDSGDMCGPYYGVQSYHRIQIGSWQFPVEKYGHHIGNVVWDCAEMKIDVVAQLLNHLRSMKTEEGGNCWLMEEGAAGIWNTWSLWMPDSERTHFSEWTIKEQYE